MITELLAGIAALIFINAVVPQQNQQIEVITDTEILVNKNLSSNTHKLVELEKQKEDILSLAKYKDKLYIGMKYDYLSKINSDGKITQIPVKGEGEVDKFITLMKEFKDNLYLANSNELLELKPNDEINKIFGADEFAVIQFLEVFNDEFYFTVALLEDYSSLMKIDSNGNFTKVLDFPVGFLPSNLKTFNNHLYYAISDTFNGDSKINTIDSNGEKKEIAVMKGKTIEHLIEFKNSLYICLDDGSLFTINANGEVKEVIKRNLTWGSDAQVVFQNELYLANSKKLEKLTEDNKIETVVEVTKDIKALATFNDELYIGMYDGYFAKLS